MDSLNNPPQVSVDALRIARNVESDYVPLRVHIYDDGDDEDQVSLAPSSETFDSASEHMAALSDTDSVGLMGSFKGYFAHSVAPRIVINRALMKLNALNSGIASLDTSLLDNTTEEEFRFRLMEIAVANNLALDDDVIHDILNTLLPLVQTHIMQNRDSTGDLTHHPPGMPIAKLTADNDSDYTENSDDIDVDLITEISDMDQSEFLPYSANVFPFCIADETAEEQEASDTLLPFPLLRLSDTVGKGLPAVQAGNGSAFCDEVRCQNTRHGGEHAELEHRGKAVEYVSVSHSADTDNRLGTHVHFQQPVGKKEGTSQKMNASSLDHQFPKCLASSVHSSNSISLSSQEEAFKSTAAKGPDKGGQNGASRGNNMVRSKHSAGIASGMPIYDDVGFPAIPPGWGQFIPCIETGIIFSGANHLTGIDDARGKLKVLRLKLLCLAIRLHQSANNVVRQVLYRLDLVDHLRGGSGSRESDLENLRVLAEGLELRSLGRLEFECTILVLGKSGVGKSATVNSLFGKFESETDAFKPATKKVKEIIGTVNGLTLRIIDTPGFLTSCVDNQNNFKILSSVKRYIKRTPPDVVLFVDRLDLQCRDYGELPLFRAISDTLGNAIWYDTIVVFTHGFSAPLDDSNNSSEHFEKFVAGRLHILQESICQAAGDMQLRNLHSIVENYAAGQIIGGNCGTLPAKETWQPQLLLLCFASKILAEADNLLRSQEKTFWVCRPQVPSLSVLLALMFQSQVSLKLPNEQAADEEELNCNEEAIDLEDKIEYEDLPFFRCLTREELISLDKGERELYHDELKHKKKLFMKKQLINAVARRKELKQGFNASVKEALDLMDNHHDKTNSTAVPITMPNMALPLSFDSDYPIHRYHSLDTKEGWIVRPVLSEEHGWDHDFGYNGLSIEKYSLISQTLPVALSGQITKEKKDTHVQFKCAASFDKKSLQAGLKIETPRRDVAYNLHEETEFSIFKKRKATCGAAVTTIGGASSAGMKLEDCLVLSKCLKLAIGCGVITAQQELAYSGYLEASLKEKHFPFSPFLSTIGLSITNWKENLVIDGICQVQVLLGKTMILCQANMNNIRTGQIRIQANSSDQFQMVLIGLIPLLRVLIFNKIAGMCKSLLLRL